MSKLVIANWKMNPASIAEAEELAKASDIEGLVICPPFPFLKAVAKVLKKAKMGAQDFILENPSTGSGQESAEDTCVEYVIIGHSDRRKEGETDEIVAEKISAALDEGLKPILCVGESRAERDSGKTEEVVGRELKIGLSALVASGYSLSTIIVAYEPIWAIGTGNPDTPENILDMVEFIKTGIKNDELGIMNVEVIYGGSVTSKNAAEFLKHKKIAGALVGGASLNGVEIKKIVEIAKKYNNAN